MRLRLCGSGSSAEHLHRGVGSKKVEPGSGLGVGGNAGRVRSAYGLETSALQTAPKANYDPTNLFPQNQNIAPALDAPSRLQN